eukprot:m.8130 g.8130  ORF g.8130 m.8130 type:complete len:69 (-) comp6109_c0_seq1:874-1080(-)
MNPYYEPTQHVFNEFQTKQHIATCIDTELGRIQAFAAVPNDPPNAVTQMMMGLFLYNATSPPTRAAPV